MDLHCHILYGIDDDPVNLQTSFDMARIAAEDGIETIVVTPHIKDIIHSTAKFRALLSWLNIHLEDFNSPVNVLQGVDFLRCLGHRASKIIHINNSRYILLEFPHNHLLAKIKENTFSPGKAKSLSNNYSS